MSSFSIETLTQLSYLAAAALFILGLKRMSSPVTAVSGVRWAGLGMLVATLATLALIFTRASQFNLILVIAAIGVGGALAWISGKRVAMTNMPQMIALYNGMGGGAAAAIAAVELYRGSETNLVHLTMADLRRLHRRGVLQRQPHRVRQTPGPDHQVRALRRSEIRQSGHPPRYARVRLHGGLRDQPCPVSPPSACFSPARWFSALR